MLFLFTGCGTATFHVIKQLREHYGSRLDSLRVLLINAGGYSQRMPSASILGKLFMALPLGEPVWQVFDLKLAFYIPFVARMKPGFFFVASDTIEVYNLGSDDDVIGDHAQWSFQGEGFNALAHPSDLEVGRSHGVYILEGQHELTDDLLVEVKQCSKVLQKPSVDTMREYGAVVSTPSQPRTDVNAGSSKDVVYTDSLFSFDHDIAEKMRQFYLLEEPFECEIQSYSDFLQPLGSKATKDYVTDTRHVSVAHPKLIGLREKIFHLLKGTPFHVALAKASRFYHLGTFQEYLENFCMDKLLAQELGLQRISFCVFLDQGKMPVKEVSGFQGCAIHSILPSSTVSGPSCILEYCDITVPVQVGDGSIISNCQYDEHHESVVNIPPDTFLHTIAVEVSTKENSTAVQYVTVCFSTKDNVKRQVSKSDWGSLSFLRKPLSSIAETLKLGPADSVFTSENCTLWDAELFPAASDMATSFRLAYQMLSAASGGTSTWDIPVTDKLWSMRQILKHKNVHAMLAYRDRLYADIQTLKNCKQ